MSDSDNTAPGAGGPSQEPLGSVTEEALKLFGALSDWAKDQGTDVGHGFAGAAAGATKAFHDVNEHVANGSPECQFCPVCRTVHLVRELSPEVKSHLAVAGASLMQAAAALLATHVPDASSPKPDGFQRIDLEDEWPEGPDPS